MGFCPVPHTTRDQVWLGVGLGLGVGLAYLSGIWGQKSKTRTASRGGRPAVLSQKPPVVNSPDLAITEVCGNATNGDSTVSVANVTVHKECEEPVQVPNFDEYVHVLSGSMVVYVGADNQPHDQADVLQAQAGQTLFLPRGHRYRYTFPGKTQYITVCLPAFSPELTGREL